MHFLFVMQARLRVGGHGLESRQRQNNLIFYETSISAVGTIQSLFKMYGASSRGRGEGSKKGLCVKLTSHFHRVSKLIMSEATVLLPYLAS
jgi:hypothetical protein